MKKVLKWIPAAALVACGYVPSQELLTARNAYNTAAQGPAAQLVPSDLHQAHTALQRAEQLDRDDQGSESSKDQAYVAVRKAEWAQARATIAQSKQNVVNSDQRLHSEQSQMLASAQNKLADVERNKELDVERQKTAQAQQLATQADQRAKEAMDKLAANEKVTDEARGQVITLPGGLLFKSGQATLLVSAYPRLDEIANVLTKTKRTLLIEGHTDAVGNDDTNQRLSERRAQAVRDYLVARGVDEARVQARGAGKSRPIADNTSTEGRALNRRVEIVVVKSRESTAGNAQP